MAIPTPPLMRLTWALGLALVGASCQAPAPRGTCTTLKTVEYCARISVREPLRMGEDVPVTLVVWATDDIESAVAHVVVYPRTGSTLGESTTWVLSLQAGVAVTETTTVRLDQAGWYTVLGQVNPDQERPAIDLVTLELSETGGTVYPANAPLPTP